MPPSTYRLQLSADFTLSDAARIVPYLQRLGVGWLYLSPVLQAEAGSGHGYDVVDPSHADADRGGDAALVSLAEAAHEAGMGLLLDIVPNHMGIATAHANPWWWDVLQWGRASRYADYFDIDWDFGGGRVRLPVLGDGPDELDDLAVEGEELVYYEQRFPLAPGTGSGTPREVHARQHYELVSWRRADSELNYRRFFAVNTLAGVRVEDERVFDDTHRAIRSWIREGLIDGLRVDHPDGLRDPGAYLERLAALADGRPIWVEKILEGEEQLPAGWPVAGTTGYEALGAFDRVLVDPAGEEPLTRFSEELAGGPQPWPELVRERKRAIGRGLLNSEIRRVARELDRSGLPSADLESALIELAAAMPVYRSYLPQGRESLEQAIREASAAEPRLATTIAELGRRLGDPGEPAALRFQQTTGMIMAKGVEDSAFYRYPRLSALNEVGGDPSRWAISPARFHALQHERLASRPHAMTALTTHDTKRSEDTRARIIAIAELPERWRRFIAELRSVVELGDAPLENLLWQAIVGSWFAGRERLEAYALKAAREAGVSTGWTDGDEAFEAKLGRLVAAALHDSGARPLVEEFVAEIAEAGYSNGLSLKLLQLLAPGVPDVYQGTERWDRSLVDPDNRRAVDFEESGRLLDRIDGGWIPPLEADGAAKLLLVSRALRLRRDRGELFTGYRPLTAVGAQAGHLIGFDRGGVMAVATRLPIGLAQAGGWGDTAIDLGPARKRDVLTGRRFEGLVPIAELLARYPAAMVVAE